MSQSGGRNNLVVLLVALFLLFAPALFLVATLEVLILTGNLVLSDISALVFLELYVIDLVLFAGLGYGVYRLTLWIVANRLPEQFDGQEPETEAPEDDAGHGVSGNDRQ